MSTNGSGSADPYRVALDTYNGPLDFLLYLINRDEIDITDIPISEVLDQYLTYLDVMQALDMEDVGDFVVLASTLMVIKSRMLLPQERESSDEEPEDEIDPRADLVQQLLQYKKFRDAADVLDDSRLERSKRHPRGRFGELLLEESMLEEEVTGGRLLEDVGLWDLFEVFSRLISEVTLVSSAEIVFDEITLEESMGQIRERLGRAGSTSLKGLLLEKRDRPSVVAVFLALLELAKRHEIWIRQLVRFGDIEVVRTDEEASASPSEAGGDTTPSPVGEESNPLS